MDKEKIINKAREEAEGYLKRGELLCSEAVFHTINNLLDNPFSNDIVKLSSGFAGGVAGSGCLCGAVSGGVMALSMIYGRTHGEKMNPKLFQMTSALHKHIKDMYNSTCCRVLTKDVKDNPKAKANHCMKISGEVAAFVIEKLLEDDEISKIIIK